MGRIHPISSKIRLRSSSCALYAGLSAVINHSENKNPPEKRPKRIWWAEAHSELPPPLLKYLLFRRNVWSERSKSSIIDFMSCTRFVLIVSMQELKPFRVAKRSKIDSAETKRNTSDKRHDTWTTPMGPCNARTLYPFAFIWTRVAYNM